MKDKEIINLFFKEFDESSFRIICKSNNQGIKRVVDNFNYNILSSITNLRIPFLFSMDQTLLHKYRLLAIESGLEIKDKEKVDIIFYDWLAKNRNECLKEIDNELIQFTKKNSINKEILVDNLLKGSVSIWTSFEVFNKDLATEIINTNPELVSSLIENGYLKKRIKSPDFNDLKENGFDMRNSLGSYIFSELDFSNYDVIKNVKKVLFDNVRLQDCIYELNQSRHIIVHKSGIIDSKFEQNTKTEQKAGNKLYIKSEDIKMYLSAVKEYVEKVLNEIKN
ncbi:MAG: hypothetical protein GQ564_15610 [Bacteroidales bacterium]|nr:hypothetical protein [Bacteroidales bacterium]